MMKQSFASNSITNVISISEENQALKTGVDDSLLNQDSLMENSTVVQVDANEDETREIK